MESVLRSPAIGYCTALVAALLLTPHTSLAQETETVQPGFPERSFLNLTRAELESFRSAITRAGLSFGLDYTADLLSNVSGGTVQGAHYVGLLHLDVDADLGKADRWPGLSFHADFFQIHGSSITAENLGSFASASNIEALPSTRLHELWFEQKLFEDRASIRVGQLAADSEFLISEVAANFVSSTFGWATLPSDNLPFGGPIYPFATPGARLAVAHKHLELKLGLYNGDPVGSCAPGLDPGECNEHGFEFRLKDPPLLLFEGAYSYNKGADLPGTIKVGGWHHFGEFDDLGNPLFHQGNHAVYATLDQVIYRPRSSEDSNRKISVFARGIVSPSDRNQIDVYGDAGFLVAGFMPGRSNDSFGVAIAYSGLSAAQHSAKPGPDPEVLMELNYFAEIGPGWGLQPLLQYIWNPAGAHEIDDVLLVGVRTSLEY